ncbi:MAG TPA: hypothetical protein DEP72_03885 [Clostridiales bacterium]|nr:hypothetical protein [Clostridiales bacterium]
MQKERLDEVKVLKNISTWILMIFLVVVICFTTLKNIGNETIYGFVLYFMSLMIMMFALIFVIITQLLILIFKNQKLYFLNYTQIKIINKMEYFIIIALADFLKIDKKYIRRFFIKVNNTAVESLDKKNSLKDILILVPHCIQNSKCEIKLTENIELCKNCGLCGMNELNKIKKEFNINIFVANGGTAARKKIKDIMPKFIIAIACERDLIEGIIDTENAPTYGILNMTPNGPCANTIFNVEELREALKKFAY